MQVLDAIAQSGANMIVKNNLNFVRGRRHAASGQLVNSRSGDGHRPQLS